MAQKTCPICDDSFEAPPSGRKTCSKKCASELRSRSHQGVSNTWSEEKRRRYSERCKNNPALKEQAARASAKAERTGAAKRPNAKIWHVVDEDGTTYGPIVNLKEWCRENADRFEEKGGWERAYAGLRCVQAWMQGKRERKVTQWKGWTLERIARPADEEGTRWNQDA
jgi:hypothetical protein